MVIVYWILLTLYILLIFVYVSSKRDVRDIQPWPLLKEIDKPIPTTCQRNEDCPMDYICMSNQCIPKLLREGTCNFGDWISYVYKGGTFAICICRQPHIFGQKFLGGECDVLIACSGHGTFKNDACQCDNGYFPGPNYTCLRKSVIDQMTTCAEDEIEVPTESDGFHPDYLQKLRLDNVRCVKRPCTFDAETQLPLKHGRYVENWGCLCDPRYGLYGVNLQGGHVPYLRGKGFDACANIYKGLDNIYITNVKMYTYYYLLNRPPISFIIFPYQGKHVVVGQNWPANYFQYVLENETLTVRARFCTTGIFNIITECIERFYEYPYKIMDCSQVSHSRQYDVMTKVINHETLKDYRVHGFFTQHQRVYASLYRFLVCRITPTVKQANEMFMWRVVLQPNLLTVKDSPNLVRFNGLQMYYGKRRWVVDEIDEYRVHEYRSMKTNAPIS